METIKDILMRRDKMLEAEAEVLIEEAREALSDYLLEGRISDAEEICYEYFGLEPDYIDELI